MMELKFKPMEYADKISAYKEEVISIYNANGCAEQSQELEEVFRKRDVSENIRVVVVGQYTAGKSTIISALTGNKNVKIDSDVSTDKVTDYDWSGGVVLTDTPGLYTENPDQEEPVEHSVLATKAIRESDLLVYCITSDLLNQYTKADFEKWAFEEHFAGKTFLVINKMSKEAGVYETLVENYKLSLNRALSPHTIDEFSYSFIDAKDYKDGVESNDVELIQLSHFEDFIVLLNKFIEEKGYLKKFDTPINIIKASIDEASILFMADENERAYFELITRVEKKLRKYKSELEFETKRIIRQGLLPIVNKGVELSMKLGIEDIDFSQDDTDELIGSCCKQINEELDSYCRDSYERLVSDISDIQSSPLGEYFYNYVDCEKQGKKSFRFIKKDNQKKNAQIESVCKIFDDIMGKTVESATKEGAKVITASTASGSKIHKAILALGKKLGVKFKPWQAAKITKNIGKVAKFAGPALSVIGLFIEIKGVVDEDNQEKQIKLAQESYRQSFKEIAEDVENAFIDELEELYASVQSNITEIETNRNNIKSKSKNKNTVYTRLQRIREELSEMQKELF